MQLKYPILDGCQRYFVSLAINISIGTILMLVLASTTLMNYPNDVARAQQGEALTLLGTYRQDLTASYYESMRWPAEWNFEMNGYGMFVENVFFDGEGGLHATFSDEVIKDLRGKTLSFIASTNPPHYTRIIWNCGNANLLPGFIALSKNQTNIPTEMLTNVCKDSHKPINNNE